MSHCFSRFVRRISQLLILMQVGLLMWTGQPVLAQAESTIPTSSDLSYSQTHALVLTGESTDEAGNFTIDQDNNLLNYRGTMTTQTDAIDRGFYKAALDDDSYSHYSSYVSGPDYLNMLSGRYGHTATTLTDGRILITGGSNGHRVLDTSVIYDPATNRMTVGPTMTIGRVWHSATMLPDGNVLILGGKTDSSSNSTSDFEGTETTNSGEIYNAKTNQFVSLDNWYSAKTGQTAQSTMLWPRARQTAVYLPSTNKVLVVGSSEDLVSSDAQSFSPTTGSIALGCDSQGAGFSSPVTGSNSVIRVSCSLSNPNPNPGETSTLTVRLDVEGNASDWGLNLPRATLRLETTGDTVIIKPRKLLGFIPAGNSVKKTSWSINPFSGDATKRQYSIELSRTKYDSTSSAVQVAEVKLTAKFNKATRSYAEVFAGTKKATQPATDSSPAQPFSVEHFLVYDYRGSSDHTMPVGDRTYYYGKTIQQLGHTWGYPTYQETFKLQPYAAKQSPGITLYATDQSSLTNSLSEFNKVAQALGARIDTSTIITDELGKVGERPAGILVINNDTTGVQTGASDESEWDDSEGLFAEVFDITTGQSTPLPESLAPNQQSSVYALPDGRAIITGGGLAKVYLYEVAGNRVTVIGSLSLPRSGMQVVAKLDNNNQPTDLFFVGGTPLSSDVQKKIEELLQKGQLPADVVDVAQMRMYDQPVSLPKIVGPLAEQAQSIRSDLQKSVGATSVWLGQPDMTKAAQAYNRAHRDLDPAIIENALYTSGSQLASSSYATQLSSNRYLLVGGSGGIVWDLAAGQAEPLLLPTRTPAHQIEQDIITHKQTGDLGAKIISHQSILNWQFDGSQFTALNDGTILVTGGMSGYGTFKERTGTGGTAAQALAHAGSVLGIGVSSGLAAGGAFVGSPLLAITGLAFSMILMAYDMFTAAKNSLINNENPGYTNRTYAVTVASNWRFMPDPYPNSPIDNVGEAERESTSTNPDLLAPPKEELAPSKPATDQQIAGKNSGYKLELSFNQAKLNPYSGSTVTGAIKLVDASGRVVNLDGGVNLQVGAGTSSLNTYAVKNDSYTSLGASEAHKILTQSDAWATKSLPVGTYSDRPATNGYVTNGATIGSWIFSGSNSSVSPDDSGKLTFSASQSGLSVGGNSPMVVLKNGVGTFTYQAEAHKYNNVTFAVTGQEQPVFQPRATKYTGTQQYIDNNPTKPVGCTVGTCEPMDVRNQRLSDPASYQIVPNHATKIITKVIPNQTGSSEPVLETSSIATVKTLTFADYKSAAAPTATQEVVSKVGYYYDVTATSPVKLKKGDKLLITVTPKTKAGQSLPADVYDGVTFSLMAGYRVYNKNYTPPSSTKAGGFVVTYPALFAENSAINKSVEGGWTAPAGELTQLSFNISKKPVTFELEYTGEPTQTANLGLVMKVNDARCVSTDKRFKSKQYSPACSAAGASPQTMQIVTQLPIKS